MNLEVRVEPEGNVNRNNADAIVRKPFPDGQTIMEVIVFSKSQIISSTQIKQQLNLS